MNIFFKSRNLCSVVMAATRVDSLNVENFIKTFDTVLTDCDGVLWLADKAISGVPETLKLLRSLGKRIFYVTNNSTKTRAEYVQKCVQLGYMAEVDEIICTAHLAANYLVEKKFSKSVYLIGSSGLAREMDYVGIKHTSPGPDVLTVNYHQYAKHGFVKNSEIGAVVVGFDEHISFPKLLQAASYLKDPDCLFVVTNKDPQFPLNDDVVVPGTGSMVAAVECCAGRSGQLIGKPSSYIREYMVANCNLDPKRTLMIGDRGNTDIIFGHKCGFQTLLVLTGCTKLEELEEWKKSSDEHTRMCIPDYLINSLADLGELIEGHSLGATN